MILYLMLLNIIVKKFIFNKISYGLFVSKLIIFCWVLFSLLWLFVSKWWIMIVIKIIVVVKNKLE